MNSRISAREPFTVIVNRIAKWLDEGLVSDDMARELFSGIDFSQPILLRTPPGYDTESGEYIQERDEWTSPSKILLETGNLRLMDLCGDGIFLAPTGEPSRVRSYGENHMDETFIHLLFENKSDIGLVEKSCESIAAAITDEHEAHAICRRLGLPESSGHRSNPVVLLARKKRDESTEHIDFGAYIDIWMKFASNVLSKTSMMTISPEQIPLSARGSIAEGLGDSIGEPPPPGFFKACAERGVLPPSDSLAGLLRQGDVPAAETLRFIIDGLDEGRITPEPYTVSMSRRRHRSFLGGRQMTDRNSPEEWKRETFVTIRDLLTTNLVKAPLALVEKPLSTTLEPEKPSVQDLNIFADAYRRRFPNIEKLCIEKSDNPEIVRDIKMCSAISEALVSGDSSRLDKKAIVFAMTEILPASPVFHERLREYARLLEGKIKTPELISTIVKKVGASFKTIDDTNSDDFLLTLNRLAAMHRDIDLVRKIIIESPSANHSYGYDFPKQFSEAISKFDAERLAESGDRLKSRSPRKFV